MYNNNEQVYHSVGIGWYAGHVISTSTCTVHSRYSVVAIASHMIKGLFELFENVSGNVDKVSLVQC